MRLVRKVTGAVYMGFGCGVGILRYDLKFSSWSFSCGVKSEVEQVMKREKRRKTKVIDIFLFQTQV